MYSNTIPDQLEIDAQKRHAEFLNDGYDRAAKYLCRWCGSAYALICLNPMCAQMGNRPNKAVQRREGTETIDGHVFPIGFTKDVKATRREQRQRDNDLTREQQAAEFEILRDAVRAFKAANPTRKNVVVRMPVLQEISNYEYVRHDAFTDYSLPKRLFVGFENVRVTLADGSYKPSTAAAEI